MPTTQTTSTVPWTGVQPYLKHGFTAAKGLFDKGKGFNAPPFQTYVPMSAQTKAGLNNIWNIASGGNPLAGQSMAAIQGILSGTPGTNPYFESALNTQSQKTADDVNRQFSGLGRYGSGADTGVLTNQVGQLRDTAMANQYNTDIQQRLAAVQAAPGAYQQQFLPAEYMSQVGAAYDDLAQRKLQSQIDRFNTNQQSGWNRLGAYDTAISGGANPGFGSTSVSKPSNIFGSILGGALSGFSASGGNPLMALLGGAGGAASSIDWSRLLNL